MPNKYTRIIIDTFVSNKEKYKMETTQILIKNKIDELKYIY